MVAVRGDGSAGSTILVAPVGQQAPSNRAKCNQASRHKNAEQRRRNRINERLDKLRMLIPHAEGTNIATFLDTVIEYVGKIQEISGTMPGEPLPLEAVPVVDKAGTVAPAATKSGAEGEPRPPTPEHSERAGEEKVGVAEGPEEPPAAQPSSEKEVQPAAKRARVGTV